jgi:hypothetical protein
MKVRKGVSGRHERREHTGSYMPFSFVKAETVKREIAGEEVGEI